MPDYHSRKMIQGANLEVAPIDWYRKIFKRWPYFVGDKILFKISINLVDQTPNFHWDKTRIYEKLPNTITRRISLVKISEEGIIEDIIIESSMAIPVQGDVEYRFAMSPREESFSDGIPIFSASIKSKDSIFLFIYGTLFGAIVSVLATLVLMPLINNVWSWILYYLILMK